MAQRCVPSRTVSPSPDALHPLDPIFRQRLKDVAANHPGVLIEDKSYSIALHYRLVPKQGVALIHDVKHAYAAWADQSYELLAGKAVLEIKCAAFNKKGRQFAT